MMAVADCIMLEPKTIQVGRECAYWNMELFWNVIGKVYEVSVEPSIRCQQSGNMLEL